MNERNVVALTSLIEMAALVSYFDKAVSPSGSRRLAEELAARGVLVPSALTQDDVAAGREAPTFTVEPYEDLGYAVMMDGHPLAPPDHDAEALRKVVDWLNHGGWHELRHVVLASVPRPRGR